MSMRIRLGPFSASTSGRVGVNAGPVSVYGGGRRRGGSGGGELLAVLVVAGVAILVIMWPLSLWGHAIHLTPSWHQLMHRNKPWLHEHYPLVGLRYVGAAVLLLVVAGAVLYAIDVLERPARQRRQEELAARLEAERMEAERGYREWLEGPPPPFQPPGRFTQNWLEDHVPYMHPGQVPMLLDELRARGWDDVRIAQRVGPLLP
jgi:hypothetical protein